MAKKLRLEKLKEAVELYNKYRAPEANAEIVDINDEHLIVKFTGSFCMWCGVDEWIEDFKYVLEDVGLKAELVEYQEPEGPLVPVRQGKFKLINS